MAPPSPLRPNLRKLTVGWPGRNQVPSGLFLHMPHLIHANFSGPELTGDFPCYGLENLENLNFCGSFTSWSAFLGSASSLKYFHITLRNLNMIFIDESFRAANLDEFGEFRICVKDPSQIVVQVHLIFQDV